MGPKLDAILPLKVDGSYGVEDLRRTDILMSSLSEFLAPGTLTTFLVVTPGAEVAAVRDYLSCWSSLPIEVMAEESSPGVNALFGSAGLAKATACEVGFQSCSQQRILPDI